MAAIVDNDVQKTKEEKPKPTPTEDPVSEAARAKGAIAIAIAKLQPTVKLLIEWVKLWAYYMLVPFRVGQLTMDVIILGLEIAKLFLLAVQDNTHVFVQLFQQLLTIFSPDFIHNILLSSSTIMTTLVETIMKDVLELVQKFIDGLTQILKPPFVPTFGLPGGMHAASASSATPGEVTEPTSGGATQQPTVNGGTPKKSDKAVKSEMPAKTETPEKSDMAAKSEKTGTPEQPEKSPPKKV